MYYITNKNINFLYLETGGLEEILNMSYWRYISIMETLNEKNNSGKPKGKGFIWKSQQDMINKTKELMK